MLAAVAAVAPGAAKAADTRYSLVNGCYSVTDTAGKRLAEKARMKATTLGRYLLFLPDSTFYTAEGPAAQPGPAADFEVKEAGGETFTKTTARGRRAQGVLVGDRMAGKGLRVKRAGRRAFVYSLRKGRVVAIGVTTRGLAKRRNALRVAMRRVVRAKASAAPRKFVPAKAQAKGQMLGRALAGSGDREVDARAALLCAINL